MADVMEDISDVIVASKPEEVIPGLVEIINKKAELWRGVEANARNKMRKNRAAARAMHYAEFAHYLANYVVVR